MAGLDKKNIPEGVDVDAHGVISCTRDALNKLGDWCRKNTSALAVSVFATAGVNTALAQTAPTSPSTSASASADKGVGVGQYTQDGRKFETLKPEDLEGLSDAEFDKYNKWNLAKNQEIVGKRQDVQVKNQEIVGKRQDVQAQLIVEYQKMIDNFKQLHNKKSTAPIYFTIKEDLKKALLAKKPPEILPQLEPLRDILMS